jgi:hypothetical protein
MMPKNAQVFKTSYQIKCQYPTLSGASIAPTSKFRTVAMKILLVFILSLLFKDVISTVTVERL